VSGLQLLQFRCLPTSVLASSTYKRVRIISCLRPKIGTRILHKIPITNSVPAAIPTAVSLRFSSLLPSVLIKPRSRLLIFIL